MDECLLFQYDFTSQTHEEKLRGLRETFRRKLRGANVTRRIRLPSGKISEATVHVKGILEECKPIMFGKKSYSPFFIRGGTFIVNKEDRKKILAFLEEWRKKGVITYLQPSTIFPSKQLLETYAEKAKNKMLKKESKGAS